MKFKYMSIFLILVLSLSLVSASPFGFFTKLKNSITGNTVKDFHNRCVNALSSYNVENPDVICKSIKNANDCEKKLDDLQEYGLPSDFCKKYFKQRSRVVSNEKTKLRTSGRHKQLVNKKKVLASKFHLNKEKLLSAKQRFIIGSKLKNIDPKKKDILSKLDPASRKKFIASNKPIVADKIKNFKMNDFISKRKLSSDKVKLLSKKIKERKKVIHNLKANFVKARDTLKSYKAKLNNCSGDECDQIKEELMSTAKSYLNNYIDFTIAHFEKLRDSAESNDALSEDELSDITSNIDDILSKLNDFKSKLEEVETKDDLNALAKDVKLFVRDTNKKNKAMIFKDAHAILWSVFRREKFFADQLEKKLAVLSEQDIDVSEESSLLDEAVSHIDSAEEIHKEIKDLIEEKDFDSVKEKVESAKNELKEARSLLIEIHKSIKDYDVEVDDEITVYDDSESDVETQDTGSDISASSDENMTTDENISEESSSEDNSSNE